MKFDFQGKMMSEDLNMAVFKWVKYSGSVLAAVATMLQLHSGWETFSRLPEPSPIVVPQHVVSKLFPSGSPEVPASTRFEPLPGDDPRRPSTFPWREFDLSFFVGHLLIAEESHGWQSGSFDCLMNGECSEGSAAGLELMRPIRDILKGSEQVYAIGMASCLDVDDHQRLQEEVELANGRAVALAQWVRVSTGMSAVPLNLGVYQGACEGGELDRLPQRRLVLVVIDEPQKVPPTFVKRTLELNEAGLDVCGYSLADCVPHRG